MLKNLKIEKKMNPFSVCDELSLNTFFRIKSLVHSWSMYHYLCKLAYRYHAISAAYFKHTLLALPNIFALIIPGNNQSIIANN